MKFLKLKLLVLALVVFAASSAFATSNDTYNVYVNTSSLAGTSGYLYLQFDPDGMVAPPAATAVVENFAITGAGSMGAQDKTYIVNGSAVSGVLPSTVTFANTNPVNDYNQAITFGSSFSFTLVLTQTGALQTGPDYSGSTFSLGVFQDVTGLTALYNASGANNSVPGTLFAINLNPADGTATAVNYDAAHTTVPVPAAAWLLCSGLVGLFGIRRKAKNA